MAGQTHGEAVRGRGAQRWLVALLGLLASFTVSAQAATLENAEFAILPDDIVEIRLGFDGAPPEPIGYSIDSPARIALDLVGVTNALEQRYLELPNANVRSLTVVETRDRTRVIVNLVELVAYQAESEGNTMVLRIGGSGAVASTVGNTSTLARVTERTSPAASDGSRVTNVDFRRGEGGEARVILNLSDPKAPIDVRTEGGNVVVEILGTELPVELRRRLDVTDFATPVQIVDAVQQGSSTLITVRPEGDWEYLAYQADGELTINVRETEDSAVGRGEDPFAYKGEKLSLNFQDIEVRSVLQLIAEFTGLNLVASDTVAGRITLRLQNVPWDQALDIVLRVKGLDKRQIGNVLLVAPATEIAAREQQELENLRQIEDLAPLRTEFIRVRYATASEVVALLTTAGEAEEGATGLLSERGSAAVDERTNSIVLTETADRITEILRVIAEIDIPVRQVLIEARIVSAGDDVNEEFGIRWGGYYQWESDGSLKSIGGENGGVVVPEGSPDGAFNPVVDLPIGADATNIAVGILGDDFLLDLQLSALESNSLAEVVSRPRVLTSDKQTATIEAGTQIPFQQASSSGATAVQFQDAVLSLEVTPQITPDDRIIMELQVTNDSVGTVFNGVPSIDTEAIQTQVLVDNGQTLVLGGIFQTSRNESVTKTPFLGDIPYVGRLFKRTINSARKDELLIFITPRIVDNALSSR